MILSASNLELLRTRPQSTRLKLSIFQPRTIFQARVNNASAAQGDRVIIYDTVTLGSFGAIEAGMTLLVGTHTAGSQNIGKVRIKSATSTTITVSENSNIYWGDNQFLTVQRYWELWPVFPRIIADPANAENVIFYKDYDIAYTDQNTLMGSFVCMGPHRAADMITGAISLWNSSTGTQSIRGKALTYNWAFEGGTPTGSTSANPGYVTYNAAGHYVTRLIVTDSDGAMDTAYRYVSIYDPNSPFISKWEVNDINGSRDAGGYTASFKIDENIDVQENAVVVLYADDWYGGVNQSLGGNFPNAEKIFYVGYILKDTIRYNYQHSAVEFETGSITELMKSSQGFSISVQSVLGGSKWYEINDLTIHKAIYHYLKWHTTALNIADLEYAGANRRIQFFDSDRTSMFDAIDNFMRGTMIGKVASDRQGKLWVEVDAMAYSNPTGSFTSVMNISTRDWMGEPTIEERLSDDLSYLEMGGIAYSGAVTGTYAAYLASAPGNAPGFRGNIETIEGLALESRVQLRRLVGTVWANRNSPYPTIDMDMAIDARNLDIAPQEVVNIHINPSDTSRNITLDRVYIPNGINWKYDSGNGMLLASINFTDLTNGKAGQTISIDGTDVDVPESDDIGGGVVVPPLQIPPLPLFTFPAGNSEVTDGHVTNVINSYLGYYCGVSREFSTSLYTSKNGFLVAISETNAAGTIQFQPDTNFLAGKYYCVAHFSQYHSSAFNFVISVTAGGAGAGARAAGSVDDTGGYKGNAAVSLIAHLTGLVTFGWTSSSPTGGGQNYAWSFSVLRISA